MNKTTDKRLQRLEASAAQPGSDGPKTWKEFVEWPTDKPLPGWDKFYREQKRNSDHEQNHP